jgi:hypothetical protein
MRAFSTLVLGAALFASQNYSAMAFSPSARAKVLTDLKEMRMTGAGGAASPDYYVEGERVCFCCSLPVSEIMVLVTRDHSSTTIQAQKSDQVKEILSPIRLRSIHASFLFSCSFPPRSRHSMMCVRTTNSNRNRWKYRTAS